jgi:DNA repair exonuclease SbcCD nuclease subunit
MAVTFLHTADWQLGKPYGWVTDNEQQIRLRDARFQVIDRLGEIARREGARFVVVAGDVFDSNRPSANTIATALGKIGQVGLPVLMIPGNHDHGGTGSLWETREFVEQSQRLAPNLRVLLTAQPVEVEGAVVLPCPLSRRMETADTSAWIRQLPPETWAGFGPAPRVVLAHGSVQVFGSSPVEGESPNQINLKQLPAGEIDYVALGDWHGVKEVGPSAWYSGTPEIDRFPKGMDNRPGHCLVVTALRGAPPQVREFATSNKAWHQLSRQVHSNEELESLEMEFRQLLGSRVNEDLMELEITGSLGLDGQGRLERMLESIRPALIALDVRDLVTITPTEQEIESLTRRAADPLISTVAGRLLGRFREETGEKSAIALSALRELYALTCRA